jgi:two-component system invasion response regulator UvrY
MNVLLIDDHAIVRAGVRRLLAGDPRFVVSEAATGREAWAAFRSNPPDLVVIDLSMPGISGLEVIRRMKQETRTLRVLVLSMHCDALFVTRALQAGALGYVSKNAPPEEILIAIERVGAGRPYVEAELAQALVIDGPGAESDALQSLSTRDIEIIRFLGEGHSLAKIADMIGLSYKTVANNCAQIKAKLGGASTADLVRLALRSGLLPPV